MTLAGEESTTPPSQTIGRSHLYLCLSKQHRVSRSVRATWFLSSLLQELPQELFVKDGDDDCCTRLSSDFGVLSMSAPPTVTAHTQLFFFCQQYSLVFLIDLSENMRNVSNHTHLIKVDSALSALQATLTLLTRPLSAPDSSVRLEPELCVTVLAYCGSAAKKALHILLQGVYLRADNCPEVLARVRAGVTQLEGTLSTDGDGLREEREDTLTPAPLGVPGAVGDSGLETMVKAGSLALQLLPRCALKGLVIFTDGISGFSSPLSMLSTVNNMRGANVSCWVVQVGGGPHPMDALGHVPDIETLRFLTTACNGCLVDPRKIQEVYCRTEHQPPPNAVQRAILLWTFQQGALTERVRGVVCEECDGWEDPFTPIIERVFTRTTITAPLLCLVGCKIREGFFIKQVSVTDSWLEVSLYFPWQPSVTIFYFITAPWPVSEESVTLQVTVAFEGPYSFVHDVHCELPVSAPYRLTAIRKFKHALQRFSSSDALLAHFLSFPATPSHYTLPPSVANGMPLFYFPPNQNKPAPSISLDSSSGKAFSPLVNFWRPMCTIDTSQWFRWFHSDKVVLVLQQDSLLPTHLLSPAPSGRYATVQCRLSASHLYNFLKEWSSLVLLDNHSYILFLPQSESPRFFCVVRVAQMLPCVVLHVGHIQGTPHSLQSTTVTSLIAALRELTFTPSERPLGGMGRKRSSLAVNTKPSVTLLDKQLQRVMIRYEGGVATASGVSLVTLPHSEERSVQMDYLSCTHWVYTVPQTTPTLLSALLRRRLKEGFLLSSSRNGVVTLIAQLKVKQPTSQGEQALLLQYVIFPFSKHPTAELWVEPQFGRVCATPPGLSYLNEATHSEIAQKIHIVDQQLLTSVSSFLFLQHRCQPLTPLTPSHGSRDLVCKSSERVSCQLDVYPGSLFESSRAIVITLTAFSEDTQRTYVDLDHCSPLNAKFWNSLFLQLTSLAPTQVPTLTNTHTLLTRITSSRRLAKLRINLSVTTATEWKYFVLSEQDSVCQLYLPDIFYSAGGGDGGGGVFVLPIVIMDCQLRDLMDPDPLSKDRPTRSHDLLLDWLVSLQHPTLSDAREGLDNLLFSLSNAHLSSYLDVVYSALTAGQEVRSHDFQAALGICSSASSSVDLTPLLAAFCPHTTIEEGVSAPLDTPILSSLLESVVSRQSWRCAVKVADRDSDETFYLHWGEETRMAICKCLTDIWFEGVPQCLGHYFWRERKGVDKDDQDEAPPTVKSPGSETSTVAQSSEEPGHSSPIDTTSDPPPPADDVSVASSDDMMDIDPLFSGGESDDEATPPAPSTYTPLFLRITFHLKNKSTGEDTKLSRDFRSRSHDLRGVTDYIKDTVPLCLKSIRSKLQRSFDYFVSMELEFLSFTPPTHSSKRSEVVKEEVAEGSTFVTPSKFSALPPQHQPTANTLKQKLDWLVADELVSIGRKATPITQPLLQAVVAHVEGTQSEICFSRRVPLRFVYGSNHSLSHFLRELETLQVPNYLVNKTGDYYYLSPRPHPPSHSHYKPPLSLIDENEIRSKTPPPLLVQPKSRYHRRSMSSDNVKSHAPKPRPISSQPGSVGVSAEGSLESIPDSGSGYDASESCSVSSVSLDVCAGGTQDVDVWIILRPLPDQVEVCLQVRSSQQQVDPKELSELCKKVEEGVARVCYRTNQWFLLKDLLASRVCSPYLLSESASEAWLDKVVSSKESREVFRGQEFMCDLKWKRHITPSWRLKDKGAQTALRITRAALDVSSVTNRQDVYVLQDISSTGVESIFYLKIDESLCRVEEESGLEESVTTTTGEELQRPETRATVEGAETISTVSAQPSVSEVMADTDKRLPPSLSGHSGKPQESLVLQLYGITPPSHDLTERLSHVVQFKLDDAVLDAMCTLYARNQRLRLHPPDVTFLQPTLSEPTYILSLALPPWVGSVEALVFYFLQNFSNLTLRPNYLSSDHRDHFQVPLELQNAYLSETCDLSHEIHQDHLFLYIRPHQKGRGMAVICVSLVSPEGRIITPIPGVVRPSNKILHPGEAEVEGLNCSITDIDSEVKGQYCLRLHVWEKGNIGLAEFEEKTITCFRHSLVDYILELHLLQLPIATPLRDTRETSPFILIDYHDRRDSVNDDLETVVEEGSIFTPPSRRISRESRKDPRRGSGDSRRGSGDSCRGSGDSRRGSGDSRRGSEDSRRGSGDVKGKPLSRKVSGDAHSGKAPTVSALQESTLEMESIGSPGDMPKRSRGITEHIVSDIRDAMEGAENGVSEEKGKIVNAHLGNCGALTMEYEWVIPEHLSAASRLKTLSVKHQSYTLLGSYSAKVFLSQTTLTLQEICPDLTVNVFAPDPSGQLLHFDPPKEWVKKEKYVDSTLRNLRYILIGRNLAQFKECLRPESRSKEPWVDKGSGQPLQLFQPLDCLKAHQGVPLQHMPIAAEAFVPRQKLALALLNSEKVDLWLYNFSDDSCKRVSERLSKVHRWQASRSGLLHHLLAQKLGLFQHTQARDVQYCTKLAVKHSPTLKELNHLARSNQPIETPPPPPRSRLQRPVEIPESPLLDPTYQQSAPHNPPRHTEDPVYNHGRQLTSHLSQQKREDEPQELLFRVFQSWKSRSQAPVNAATITALKRMSRLLHYCSTPVLSVGCSKDKDLLDRVKDTTLTQYIAYLHTLGFQPVAERSSTRPRPPLPSSPAQVKLYKCLQRWWAGGIIFAELRFHDDSFLVKLYGLEASRLINESPLTPESQSLFSLECTRYKDFIHVHSFMLDFDLRLLLSYIETTPPENFDLRQYIKLCQERPRPHFARNLLNKGTLDVAMLTVQPRELYQYLIVHCAMFRGQTLELRVGRDSGHEGVGLLIKLTRESLGPITSPQLFRLMEDAQDKYDIRVVMMLRLPNNSTHVLGLDYYLLLVARDDTHPLLIRHTPQLLPTCHTLPSGDSDEDVSGLNLELREHCRKMGLLSTPPQAPHLVLDDGLMREHMAGVRVHLEEACQEALRHMRRDLLWKRLIYGQVAGEGGRAQGVMEGLTCSEFRELLRLVTLVPLEMMDHQLAPLKRQTRKWFRRLILPLQVRFSETIRLYSTQDESFSAVVIVNPDWQDMCLLVQIERDKDTRLLASMYRHPKEGGVPSQERLLTANPEAERAHIETVVNFMCSFMWASILDYSPPQPHLNLL